MIVSSVVEDEGRPPKFTPDWPPKPIEKPIGNVLTRYNDQFKKVSWPPKSGGQQNGIENPSQTLQLRNELPLNADAAQPTETYKAAPTVYAEKPENLPVDVWPPPEPINTNERAIHDPHRPKCATRDYSFFFNKNVAPPTQPVYRVPPGTLHVISQRGVLTFDSPDLGGARMAQE